MSSTNSTRQKRGSSSTPAADGDHRKRRRNRTTQSCLNCHTSKRMCDRKRPACARCTQLGLTGLCVYEVDDPNQRPESQDESSRLLKRVAELEGVIRELKNKPHPRWSQPGTSPGGEYDRWHSRSQPGHRDGQGSTPDPPSPPSSLASSEKDDASYIGCASTRSSRVTRTSDAYQPPALSLEHRPSSSQSSYYYASSPQSTPSPALMTPTEEFPQTHPSIGHHPEISTDYDLAAMFLAYPGLAGCEESNFGLLKTGHADDSCFLKQHGGHCGCLHDPTNYNVVLELSIRLRKAADILARSVSHHMGSNCLLNQRISDLDTFATNALGNITSPLEDLSLLTPDRLRANTVAVSASHSGHQYGANLRKTAKLPNPSTSLRSWDSMPMASSPLIPCDDSFMSWEPPRRS